MMFAIRQKSTGYFMPAFPGRAGGTWVEPAADKPPRLFSKRQHAKAALAWWLSGHVTVHYDMYGEYDGDMSIRPVPSRRADDMEVVEVRLAVSA